MQEKQRKKLLLDEYGSSYKAGVGLKVALVFPDSYYLGMSSLGFQVILDEINHHPDTSCERFFYSFNSNDRESHIVPKSFESQRALSEYDIIGFSVSFELDYINLVKMLVRAGIPIRAIERGALDPFIIAGGICPSFNPEPVADFIDAFVIGDGEEVIHSLLFEYQNWLLDKNRNRKELYLRLSKIKGVYIPSLYSFTFEDNTLSKIQPLEDVNPVIERFNIKELDKYDTTSKILTPNTEFENTFLIEVARGCPNRCKFCVSSYIQKCKIRSKNSILSLSQSDLAKKAHKIGLLGSSASDHPEIGEIATCLVKSGKKISIASLRADSISTELLAALAESGQKTITLAPETASEDMRKAIGKDIPQEVILDVIAASLKLGIIDIKLYFMVGLPYEKQDDIDNMIKFVELTRHVAFSYPRPKVSISPGISISISPFVPKPHTPFQWCQMESSKTLSQKLRFLRSRLSRLGGVKVSCSSAKWSIVQGILSRGDRRLGNVLYDISTKEVTWDKALKMNNLNQEIYLRKRKLEEIFPWDHLDIGMAKSSLIRSYIPIESFRN